MVGQLPATWYASSTNGNLAGSITPTTTSAGMAKVKAALSTLPGKLSLPDNFDPVTTGFNAVKDNEVDDLLEVYGAALTAAGLTQEDAGKAAWRRGQVRHSDTTTAMPMSKPCPTSPPLFKDSQSCRIGI